MHAPELKQLGTALNKLRNLSVHGICFVELDLVWTKALVQVAQCQAPSVEIFR